MDAMDNGLTTKVGLGTDPVGGRGSKLRTRIPGGEDARSSRSHCNRVRSESGVGAEEVSLL